MKIFVCCIDEAERLVISPVTADRYFSGIIFGNRVVVVIGIIINKSAFKGGCSMNKVIFDIGRTRAFVANPIATVIYSIAVNVISYAGAYADT